MRVSIHTAQHDKLLWALLIILTGVLALGLIACLDIGLADNGDFTRAMTVFTSKPIGFEINWPDPINQRELWERRFFKYYIPYWKLDFPEPLSIERPFKSSAYILWYPGVLINQIFYSDSVLNVGVMSLPSRLILLSCFAILLHRLLNSTSTRIRKWIIILAFGIPVALMLLSPYVYYLNSFYYEAAGLVFLLIFLCLSIFVSSKPWSFAKTVLVLIPAAFLVGASKAQWFYWPALSMLAIMVMQRRRKEKLPLRRWLLIAMVTFVASLLSFWFTQPADYAIANNTYHRFFLGVLSLSARPERHVADLGVPNAIECVGVNVYTEKGQECKREVEGVLGWIEFCRILYKEPLLLFRMLEAAAEHMHVIKVDYLGIFAENDPRTLTPMSTGFNIFEIWTKIKLLFPRGWFCLAWLFICGSICWITSGRDDEAGDLGIIGIVTAAGALFDILMIFVGEGLHEIEKHLFLANVTFDIATIATLNIGLLSLNNVWARLTRLG